MGVTSNIHCHKCGVTLVPLRDDDREQFILDNQRAFRYGAQEEFGMRDDRAEESDEIISHKTIERSMDSDGAETYRIVHEGIVVGGLIIRVVPEKSFGELVILYIHPEAHSRGLGQAAWRTVEALHPEVHEWETITPYYDKRNIHFYVNRCGFHVVEFWNKFQHGPEVPEDIDENWSEEDEIFLLKKTISCELLEK